MKILVTGASGFIGGYVAMELAGISGNRIIATGRTATSRFKDYANIECQKHDLTSVLPEFSCDVCIHVAGLADAKSTANQFELANIYATSNLTGALKDCACFILVSSASVYDFADGRPKEEQDAYLTNTISDYGRSKLKAEAVVRESSVPSVYILRPRAVYGRGDRVLLPRILKLIGKHRTIVPGPMESVGSMTHVHNLYEAIVKCIEKMQPGVHTYNITDREIYRLKDVFAEISFLKNGHRKFFHVPMPVVDTIIATTKLLGIKSVLTRQSVNYLNQDSVLRIDRAMEELDYSPSRSFFNSTGDLNI